MTKGKDIKNSSFASIELNELLNNYNNDRDQQVILTRNFNEIDTPPARIEGAASGGGISHKLYNKNSKSDHNYIVGMFRQLGKINPDGYVTNLSGKKVSQNASMKEIEAFNEVH